jgi:hypothetical protein
MIARLQALTGLEFDIDAVKAGTRPNISGAIVDSTNGWPIDHAFPHYRRILSPDAIHHGYVSNTADPREENINERVHWSVIAKREDEDTALRSDESTPTYSGRKRRWSYS